MKKGTMAEAISQLNLGEVVGMPTETVYGLAGRIDLESGIQNIFKVKSRPFFDPLIVHVDSIAMAQTLTTSWNPLVHDLAEKFWPGPLTLVLKKSALVSDLITSGLASVGIRMPHHPLAQELIRSAKVPLAAPSANRFGRTSPTSAEHVLNEFPDYSSIVLDGGPCQVGLESTVLSVRQEEEIYLLSILREGAVLKSHLEKALQESSRSQCFQFQFVDKIEKRSAPGQMKHHYMPEIPLVIVEDLQVSTEEVLQFAESQILQLPQTVEGVEIRKPKQFKKATEISLPVDPTLAARMFYSQLRDAGEKSSADILLIRFLHQKDQEVWKPLQDRLYKAASIIYRRS